MDKERMKSEITKLIEKYNREKGKRYNEEATKNDFILPLFKILGWDVEDSNEVSKEENISGKRVDYGFRIDGIPKFFLEAKGLDEDLEGSRMVKGRQVTYAEQAINYAYYKGCNYAILTNFKGIIVYDAWAKANSQSSFRFAIWVDSLLNDFESVCLLSKEAFEQGLLDKKYSTKSRKRPITEQLLLDFTTFRSILSKDVYNLNKSKNLTEEELDEAIQRLFDRLIFIRNCEDRELEPYELLSMVRQWKESRKGTLVSKIRELFVHFDDTYNSKIFSKHLCDQVDISDEALSRVLDGLYTTEDGSILYDFSLIDADVLGNIYEQYLGHILKKTEKRTKLTESKAKRKEEGIYYTPSYIVDYIVRNTVGELVKSKKVDVSKIKVLDPACGSGSFLIKTFDVLNEYYSKKEGYNQNKLDLSGTGTTYTTKLSILKDNIFGVDLDKQAVDIAQLNLLLKVAEKKKRLPILQQNIKNGNSLIDDPNLAGDKAFKWNEEFAEIMNNGGFDVIVGNPPYIMVTSLDNKDKQFFAEYYKTSFEQYNIYYLFYEKAINLIENKGVIGFITPIGFLNNTSGLELRKLILRTANILQIVDISHLRVFKDASTYPIIVILQKEADEKARSANIIKVSKFVDMNNTIQSVIKIKQKDITKANYSILIDSSPEISKILNKIETNSVKLNNIALNYRGMQLNKINVLDERRQEPPAKNEFIFNAIHLRDVKKWLSKKSSKVVFHNDKRAGIKKRVLFGNEKILIPRFVLDFQATYSNKNEYILDNIYVIHVNNDNIFLKYLLAILNSKLMNFYYKYKYSQTHIGGDYFAINGKQLENLPIRLIDKSKQKEIISIVDEILGIKNKLNLSEEKDTDEKKRLEANVVQYEAQINDQIFKIYGITEEEKKIIEKSG